MIGAQHTAAMPEATPAPGPVGPAGERASGSLGSFALIRLVAGREISTRIRDKTFVISSVVILLLILGAMVFQYLVAQNASKETIGVVGDRAAVQQLLVSQGDAVGLDVTVVSLPDEQTARAKVESGDVDGAVVDATGDSPRLIVDQSASDQLTSTVQGAVAQLAVSRQLAAAGIDRLDVPHVGVTALEPQSEAAGQRIGVTIVSVVVLYTLLIMLGQFVAMGVVEEKSTRVVELLLATMRPWQLLSGKILGLGLLGLAQIIAIAVVGVGGALGFGVIDLPMELISTVGWVVGWFVLGYAFYSAVFAALASLVSRQEDLASAITPMSVVLIVGFFIAIQAASNPGSTLSVVTSYVPGLSPLVMPVRAAAGVAAWWELVLAVALQLIGIALVVRLGGRIYAGALLRTGGKTKIREALRGAAA